MYGYGNTGTGVPGHFAGGEIKKPYQYHTPNYDHYYVITPPPAYAQRQSSLFHHQQLPLMKAAGANARGGEKGGWGGFLEASVSSSPNAALLYPVVDNTGGASMNDLDLTLKL